MERERLETYALAAVGLVRGVFEVYIRPVPSDLAKWATGRLISFEVPEQETIDNHIKDVADNS